MCVVGVVPGTSHCRLFKKQAPEGSKGVHRFRVRGLEKLIRRFKIEGLKRLLKSQSIMKSIYI